MANREACELYIEQEIKEGLESGKKPYSIGKDLSAWVERVFDTHIKPDTIKKRAERQQKKNGTNVPTKIERDSGQKIVTAVYYDPTNKPEKKTKQNKPKSTALGLAEMAIYQLSMIRDDDPKRDDALSKVEAWILKNR